ncbi:uncharacterized protein TRUGW13939_04016 [Talaromyces rugulosus]|uniref:Uncharacterized protein n=1 Tax=Talaromyces rugulosus TaxID=121627 RepID=A0A7H8QSY4_TALRU|nr:uncharacterized protein TRUGW13939_04016 [Talaromyces rugulosus]QKX56908.1 hypothetical protein TRUGW13939_04016 [Talaromyces rugulosus]
MTLGEDSTTNSGELLKSIDKVTKDDRKGDWSSYPLDFEDKWPLTRAERVQELEELLSRHYFKTMQRENIKGAIAYHAGFPPDEVMPDESVCFQGVKIVEVPVSEIDPEKGPPWLRFYDRTWPRTTVQNFSGDKITLKTNDPKTMPLPNCDILKMQWFLQRPAAISGVAESYNDDYHGDLHIREDINN